MDENDIDALLYLGEVSLEEEDYEKAVRHLSKAQEVSGGQNGKVREALGKAQMLLKRSKTKDYYKILGNCTTSSGSSYISSQSLTFPLKMFQKALISERSRRLIVNLHKNGILTNMLAI